MTKWKNKDHDELLLALMEHPQVGHYLRKHGFNAKKEEILREREQEKK